MGHALSTMATVQLECDLVEKKESQKRGLQTIFSLNEFLSSYTAYMVKNQELMKTEIVALLLA